MIEEKVTYIYLPILSILSIGSFVPVIQLIAATLTIIIGVRQIVKGVREEGTIKGYILSFFKKK